MNNLIVWSHSCLRLPFFLVFHLLLLYYNTARKNTTNYDRIIMCAFTIKYFYSDAITMQYDAINKIKLMIKMK